MRTAGEPLRGMTADERHPHAAVPAGAMALLLVLAAPAAADSRDVPALLDARRCNACHAMEQPLIGPPYRAIAARHGARAAFTEAALAHKIILGGGGNWGVVPMVPNEHVTPEEARAMAHWILQLQPGAE